MRDNIRDIAVLRSWAVGAIRECFSSPVPALALSNRWRFRPGVVFCAYIEEIRQLLVMITGAQLFPAEVYFLERMPARLVMSDCAGAFHGAYPICGGVAL